MQADPLIPLAYSRKTTPATEMVWIVRFVAAYILAATLLQAAPEIVRAGRFLSGMAWSVWLNRFGTGSTIYGLFRACAALAIALALWRLRREAFWGLVALSLLPDRTIRFEASGQLLSWIMTWPSAMIVLAAVLMVYRRASRRGVLRTHSLELVAPSAGVDVRWFMGIVGFWILIPVVDWVVGLMTPWITGLYGFAFGDLLVTNCVSIVLVSANVVIGLVLIARRNHRVLPLLAALYLVGGIMSDLAIRWDVLHNPKFAGANVGTYLAGSIYGLTMATLVTALYLRARRWAHEAVCGNRP